MHINWIRIFLAILVSVTFMAGGSASAGSKPSVSKEQSGFPEVVSAGAPISPPINIALNEYIREYYSVAYNTNYREFLVTWHEHNEDDFGRSIYGRRVDIFGNLIGAAFPIFSVTDKSYSQSDIVYIPKHNAYWIASIEEINFEANIWVKLINWKGETISQKKVKSGIESPGFPTLAMAYDNQGDRVMIVYENRLSASNHVIGAICLKAADGGKCGEKDISSSSTKRLRAPDIAFNPTKNDYLILYTEFGGEGDGNIKGKFCKPDLSSCKAEVSITIPGYPWQDCPMLAAGPDEFFTTWWERYGTDSEAAWGRRIEGDGSTESFINLSPTGPRYGCPYPVYGDTGRYLVVNNNPTEFFGRWFLPGVDTPQGDPFTIETKEDFVLPIAAACYPGEPCMVVYPVYHSGQGTELRGRLVGYWNMNNLPFIYKQ